MTTRLFMVGCGGMARHHIRTILGHHADDTVIAAACEPSGEQWELTAEIFEEHGVELPPNEPDFDKAIKQFADEVDASFIVTPHVFHYEQAAASLEAGLDVLLEKPMVMNAKEARDLIAVRDRTGGTLVVAFPGSLSPNVRTAAQWIQEKRLGAIRMVSANSWQRWKLGTVGKWRQDIKMSGGGFLIDTGAHLLNTTSDLVGEPFVEVCARMDNRDAPVDIDSSIIAKTASGTWVTMTGCGDSAVTGSMIYVYGTEAMIQTGIWGERLLLQVPGEPAKEVPTPPSTGVWQQFLGVITGEQSNPCPPEVGLRMALLWDAINESNQKGGAFVEVPQP